MSEEAKIILSNLSDSKEEKFEFFLASDDPTIVEPIHAFGVAYLAENALIIQLTVEFKIEAQCTICNEKFTYEKSTAKQYITVELENISNGAYNLASDIRDAVILETPNFLECNQGSCPERAFVSKYLKSSGESPEGFLSDT